MIKWSIKLHNGKRLIIGLWLGLWCFIQYEVFQEFIVYILLLKSGNQFWLLCFELCGDFNCKQYPSIPENRQKETCRQEHKFRCCLSIYCFFFLIVKIEKKMKKQIWIFFNESTHFMCYYVHLLENWNLTGVHREMHTIHSIWWCCLEFMINHHHTTFNTSIQFNPIRWSSEIDYMIARNNLSTNVIAINWAAINKSIWCSKCG